MQFTTLFFLNEKVCNQGSNLLMLTNFQFILYITFNKTLSFYKVVYLYHFTFFFFFSIWVAPAVTKIIILRGLFAFIFNENLLIYMCHLSFYLYRKKKCNNLNEKNKLKKLWIFSVTGFVCMSYFKLLYFKKRLWLKPFFRILRRS